MSYYSVAVPFQTKTIYKEGNQSTQCRKHYYSFIHSCVHVWRVLGVIMRMRTISGGYYSRIEKNIKSVEKILKQELTSIVIVTLK